MKVHPQALQAFTAALCSRISPRQVQRGVMLSRYTTLRLGGPAEVFVTVERGEDVSAALTLAKEHNVPVTILGNGTNVLVLDGGIRGLVLHLGEAFSGITLEAQKDGRTRLTARAGTSLVKLSNTAADNGLGGLAFACGIPGTVGGGVMMNAGAYGGELKDVVSSVTVCDRMGNVSTLEKEALAFGYRTSAIAQRGDVVLSVDMALSPADPEVIRAHMRDFAARRREKQPVTLPSCGSTFKRPQGHFAGALIQQCNLMGVRIGGASVSTLHAGFLVNDKNGTSADYLALIQHVQATVYAQTGVQLEPEVRIIGEVQP